eukprot:4198225-Amphidinium_carterae.1
MAHRLWEDPPLQALLALLLVVAALKAAPIRTYCRVEIGDMPTLDGTSQAQSHVLPNAAQLFAAALSLLREFALRDGAPLLALHTRGNLAVPLVMLMQLAALHPQPRSGNPLGSRIDSSSRTHTHLQLVDHLCLDVVSQVTFELEFQGNCSTVQLDC